jgi:hypothetical protein
VRAPEYKLIAEYLDVVGLCRGDIALTDVEERKEWQKVLKGLHSVALNKWPATATWTGSRGCSGA